MRSKVPVSSTSGISVPAELQRSLRARGWGRPVLRSVPMRSSSRYQNGAPSTAAPTEISRPRIFNGQPQAPSSGLGADHPSGMPVASEQRLRASSAHLAWIIGRAAEVLTGRLLHDGGTDGAAGVQSSGNRNAVNVACADHRNRDDDHPSFGPSLVRTSDTVHLAVEPHLKARYELIDLAPGRLENAGERLLQLG